MPRKSRSAQQRRNLASSGSKWQRGQLAPGGRDISRILDPAPTVEHAKDGDWFVQFMPAVNARKTYKCPECHRSINPGIAHLVVWREDHMFGRDRAVEERRHWHEKCWRTRRMY
ncbi:ATP/GTP-binding protein [Rothia sp. LK2588]|uniref:ATP/GTP-binding protein n=1 Tax=Rothia sp. LK2588 TaxID=3114369 RepID=UPI0034CEBF8F